MVECPFFIINNNKTSEHNKKKNRNLPTTPTNENPIIIVFAKESTKKVE